MPPEQAEGRWSDVGAAADIYSLGAILYELLTGVPPFQGRNDLDVQAQVIGKDPVPPRRRRRAIPRDLEVICLKCLAKAPVQRYASASDLANDLRRFLADEPIVARRPNIVQRSWKQLTRHPATVAALLFLSTTLALGFGFWAWEIMQERRLTRLARQGEYVRLIGEANDAFGRGDYPQVGALLNRLRPNLGEEDHRGFEWRYLLQQFWNVGPRFRMLPYDIASLAFSPDGRYVAAACGQVVQVLNAGTGETVAILRGHASRVEAVAFAPDSKELASASQDGSLRFWHIPTGTERSAFFRLPAFIHFSVAQQSDRLVMIGDGSLWSSRWHESMPPTPTAVTGLGPIGSSELTPDGRQLFIQSASGLSWHEADSGRLIAKGGKLASKSIVYSADGHFVAHVVDNKLSIFDGSNRNLLATHSVKECREAKCGFLGPDNRFFTCGAPPSQGPGVANVQVLNWKTGELLASTTEASLSLVATMDTVAPSPDGRIIGLGCTQGVIRYWLPQGAGRYAVPEGHEGEVWCVAYSPDGRTLASGGDDHVIRLWDRLTGRQVEMLPHPNLVVSEAFAPNGNALAAGCYDGSVHLWDMTSGRALWSRPIIREPIRRIRFTPDGAFLLVAGDTDTVIGLATVDGTESFRLKGASENSFAGLAISRDGTCVHAGDGRGVLHTWEISTGRQLWQLGDLPIFTNLVLSPDGLYLASCHNDGSVRILNARDGALEQVLTKHKGVVRALAFGPDGRTLASAGDDHQVRLWHIASGRELLALRGPTQQVNSLAFSPDGQLLAAACHDGHIYLWQAMAGDSGPPPEVPPSSLLLRGGVFDTMHRVSMAGAVSDLIVADVENSGAVGILALCSDSDVIQTLRTKGNRQFESVRVTPALDERHFVVADLNKDGSLDLACAPANKSVVQAYWSKNGEFANVAGPALPAGTSCRYLAAGDLDGDGRADLLGVQPQANAVKIWLGRKGDQLQPQADLKTPDGPVQMALGDINGDGILDLVVACAGGNCVSIHLGNGDGTFTTGKTIATGKQPAWVGLVDLNADGNLDLVVAQEGEHSLGVFLSTGKGEFGPRRDFASGKGCCALVAADLNGDGIIDLAAANRDDATLAVFLGRGTGAFEPARHFQTGKGPHRLAVADLDRDGKKDIIVGCQAEKAVVVHFGK
jgi:WD40 repeat protein